MTSNKQLHANRANATTSTGPRSQAGKLRSRLNSRKHGLTAKMLIIVGENADDFDQLRTELMAEHDPQSTLECELVERLAGILWRLRRVPFFEAAILDSRQLSGVTNEIFEQSGFRNSRETGSDRNVSPFGQALINDAGSSDALGKLARHEATLMNAFTKTLQMLLLLQNNRAHSEGDMAKLQRLLRFRPRA